VSVNVDALMIAAAASSLSAIVRPLMLAVRSFAIWKIGDAFPPLSVSRFSPGPVTVRLSQTVITDVNVMVPVTANVISSAPPAAFASSTA